MQLIVAHHWNVELLGHGLGHFGVQALAHFDAASGDGDSAVALVHADVAVVGQREVVDLVLAGHQSYSSLAPHVILKDTVG